MFTVYTALYGKRDRLHPPLWSGRGVRYLCFTDDETNRAPGVETVLQKPPLKCLSRSVRWHKTHPPTRGISLWMDGVFQLIGDPRPVLASIKEAVALFPHPTQSCIYQEAIQCAARKKDHPRTILRQVMRYYDRGYPSMNGMWQGGLIFRRAACGVEWQALWWDEIENGSFRDQISFPYVAWKTGLAVGALPDLRGSVVRQYDHDGIAEPLKEVPAC